jgi:outer membrane protein assembly factor BamB
MRFSALLAIALFSYSNLLCSAADWPHWRGPNRNDVTSELSGYTAGGWPLKTPAWQCNVGGTGETSPIIADGRLYTMGWNDGKDTVYCLDVKDGKVVWKQSYPCPPRGRFHFGDEGVYAEGPLSTPEYDASTGLLYTLSCDGDLMCWDTRKEGAKIWGFNLYSRYTVGRRPFTGGEVRDYGYTSSPMVLGNLLLVEVGAQEGSVMAFDKRTGGNPIGTPVWKSVCTDPPGHTGGFVPAKIGGMNCLALLTLRNLLFFRIDPGHEGQTITSYPYSAIFDSNVVTPVIDGDLAALSTHHGVSDDLVQFGPNKVVKVGSIPHSEVGVPIFYKGYFYRGAGWLEKWTLSPAGNHRLWQGENFGGEGYVIMTGDQKLIAIGNTKAALYTLDGKELSTVDNFPTGWQQPALAEGRLFCKSHKGELWCYLLSK